MARTRIRPEQFMEGTINKDKFSDEVQNAIVKRTFDLSNICLATAEQGSSCNPVVIEK